MNQRERFQISVDAVARFLRLPLDGAGLQAYREQESPDPNSTFDALDTSRMCDWRGGASTLIISWNPAQSVLFPDEIIAQQDAKTGQRITRRFNALSICEGELVLHQDAKNVVKVIGVQLEDEAGIAAAIHAVRRFCGLDYAPDMLRGREFVCVFRHKEEWSETPPAYAT